ncbi:MAG: hypothetical protein Terrestrivirus1_9 [Terrestrivirus sp.]|uniref:Uncharacterized protein n=1 Tax=Terrestrivirus sp. TaxID=2487775 RepID=A0A3G4ZJY5_9VIRU|nr:MAG: hypothetical protein Terrestrivirus1_9 [Terrestrivirus sp.]
MSEIIKKIHDDDIFGIFIETGPFIAPALLNVSGASKTIYFSECPYSKKYVETKYGINLDVIRAVDINYAEAIINYYSHLVEDNTINTIFVGTFQVGDIDQDIVTHGWIGLRYKNKTVYYHITIRDKISRLEYIDKIKNTAIHLLLLKNEPLTDYMNLYIDNIITFGSNNLYNVYNYMNKDDVICVGVDGRICRSEDIFRTANKDNIIVCMDNSANKYQTKNISYIISYTSYGNNINKVIELISNSSNCVITYDYWNKDKIEKFFADNFSNSKLTIISE